VRALIIEDEESLRRELVQALERAGYAVDHTGDGDEGRFMGDEYALDVAVVDLGLPGISGMDIIRHWRATDRRFPVLILTARDRWQDKVEGLEAGADDYLVKPFNLEELLARLRALVRRAAGWSAGVIENGPLTLDTRAQEVRRDGDTVSLTAFEYKLAEYLMLHAGKVVSKSELGDHVYAEDLERDSNVLEVLVGRLRRKLDPQRTLAPIETLRGQGYRFRAPDGDG
jgi:two-component system response regulator PhoP